MKQPNFLIIGSPKSGTTSLYQYLSQHPEIEFSDRKEPKFFCWKDKDLDFCGNEKVLEQIKQSTIQDLNSYLMLFQKKEARFIGEASADYFHTEIAPQNIREFNPRMKLILVLRNPIERAYSDWRHNVKMGYEPVKSFRKAIACIGERRLRNGVPYFEYLEKGNYSKHLKRYYEFFDPENILVLTFDELEKDANAVCNQIIHFLGIQESFHFNVEKVHMKNSYTPKYYVFHRLAKKLGALSSSLELFIKDMNALPKRISRKEKVILLDYYKKEILELEKLINRNLQHWIH